MDGHQLAAGTHWIFQPDPIRGHISSEALICCCEAYAYKSGMPPYVRAEDLICMLHRREPRTQREVAACYIEAARNSLGISDLEAFFARMADNEWFPSELLVRAS